MKFQPLPNMGVLERRCLVCRKADLIARLLLNYDDADRLNAFYCIPCVTKGYAAKLAKKRARAAKKRAGDDWRTYGADHLVEAPPLQPDA